MPLTLEAAISAFGAKAKAKLRNVAVSGQPEDQLRAPFENLLADLAELCSLQRSRVEAVGESAVGDLKTRPDYAIIVSNALIGFVELKAPGKGADPRKFKDAHDKEQWEKLRSLPNLIYTDGNAFSHWRNGKLVGDVIELEGDIKTSGDQLRAPRAILRVFEDFLRWNPTPPRTARELAEVTARLCRLLRDEVTEQLAVGSRALTELAVDWRQLLFPLATDKVFADGYAQAVTFGLLMARAKGISLAEGLQKAASELSRSSTLIGGALRLLTDNAANQETLKTSLGTLTRVLEAVNWRKIGKGKPEAWLYFYEDFLEVYDNDLRKKTGSYYTPPEVVSAMVGLVDEALRSNRFGLPGGFASPTVTVVDPATGTGTFILGVLKSIAQTVESDEGAGAVKAAIDGAVKRLIAFEMQLGPFAVAQLRILAEVVDLAGSPPSSPIRMYVADTLGNPKDDGGWIPSFAPAIAHSLRDANKIKREEPVTVVIGNPPYKEKAKGRGAWVEGEDKNAEKTAPLAAWMPPRAWGVGAHAKHLRNLYVYFWRWATWKVFDHDRAHEKGIVCFITVAGFLNGHGFQKMRDYLRRTCDDIWVIDCSPEGHQPEVNTRIFQGVQQPVCIVLASRSTKRTGNALAKVRFRALPKSHRVEKFKALNAIKLKDRDWIECPRDGRAPFLPESTGSWTNFPALEDLFIYNGSGVMPGRTWIIAPDSDSLERRWEKLINAPAEQQEALFHPHQLKVGLGDRHRNKVVSKPLSGFPHRPLSIAAERDVCLPPIRYGFRSFDRQWIIPDNRLINRPNPELWEMRSERQVYLTAPSDRSPTNGPALTFSEAIPDLHHYNGRGGRVFALWRDRKGRLPNLPTKLLTFLGQKYGRKVSANDLVAYIAAIAAHPAFTKRFKDDLSTPGLRIPVTADRKLFARAVKIGRRVIWLHTFGNRMANPKNGRDAAPPRLPKEKMPRIPKEGAISQEADAMPDSINYNAAEQRLLVGAGYVENVDARVWNYEVSGKQVLLQWFSYRKANRERPLIGDRRPPSKLGEIQPDSWLPEYTSELINLINVLGLLVELEEPQAALLKKICRGSLISDKQLRAAGVFAPTLKVKAVSSNSQTPDAFAEEE